MLSYQENETYRGATEIILHETFILTNEAKIAEGFMSRWGMVAGFPDGEDTHGRQKLRLLTPEELVERSCKTVEFLFKEIKKRNWYIEVPVPKPPVKKNKEEM